MKTDPIPFAERLTCTVPETCQATGLKRTKLYELIGSGQLHTQMIGRRRLVSVRSLADLLNPAVAEAADRGHEPLVSRSY